MEERGLHLSAVALRHRALLFGLRSREGRRRGKALRKVEAASTEIDRVSLLSRSNLPLFPHRNAVVSPSLLVAAYAELTRGNEQWASETTTISWSIRPTPLRTMPTTLTLATSRGNEVVVDPRAPRSVLALFTFGKLPLIVSLGVEQGWTSSWATQEDCW